MPQRDHLTDHLYYVQRGSQFLSFERFEPTWVYHPKSAIKTPRIIQARMWAAQVGGTVLCESRSV